MKWRRTIVGNFWSKSYGWNIQHLKLKCISIIECGSNLTASLWDRTSHEGNMQVFSSTSVLQWYDYCIYYYVFVLSSIGTPVITSKGPGQSANKLEINSIFNRVADHLFRSWQPSCCCRGSVRLLRPTGWILSGEWVVVWLSDWFSVLLLFTCLAG